MAGLWIVRVQDREYGPVGVEELREWKREGRLIRENEVREPGSERWIPAGELPEIFADELDQAPSVTPAEAIVRPVRLGEIFATGWRVYRKGFGRFVLLAALVALPAFLLQLAAPFLEMTAPGQNVAPTIVGTVVVFLMLVLLVIGWPFSLAGMQLLAADLVTGKDPALREIFTRSKPLWGRMIGLGFVVYGSYFLWTIIPLLVALTMTAGGAASLPSVLLILALLIFTVYMVARLFINFLFWQQAGALGTSDMMGALRESKELARGGAHLRWWQRPLYRGALLASLWLLVIIVLNLAIELPVVVFRLRGVTDLEQAATILQSMATTKSLDVAFCLTTFLSSLVHAVLRPWLAATFVALYLDTKRHCPRPPDS